MKHTFTKKKIIKYETKQLKKLVTKVGNYTPKKAPKNLGLKYLLQNN